MTNLLKSLLQLLPAKFVQALKDFKNQRLRPSAELKSLQQTWRIQRQSFPQKLREMRNKDVINVIFFVQSPSVWKYEEVYRIFDANPRFSPLLVVTPLIHFGEEAMFKEMKRTVDHFGSMNYKVRPSFDEASGAWLDVRSTCDPDILFFANPHNNTRPEYYITHYADCLTCYAPYAFVVIHMIQIHYDQVFQKVLWKHFCETDHHKAYADRYMPRKESNAVVTGFPGLDRMLDVTFKPKSVWKKNDPALKKIIWAPHHSIDDDKTQLSYSNFLNYAELMLRLTETHKDRLEIAFKPHPNLIFALYDHQDWGKDKTDQYFERWKTAENGQLEEGEYIDLFATSDAMILDSASFMVEYLYTGKPSLFTMRDGSIRERFNDFGQIVFDHLYQSTNEDEIMEFVQNVVLENRDEMKEKRDHFFQKVIKQGDQTASERIVEEILNEL